MSNKSKFRIFEIVGAIVAGVFLVAIPLSAVLCLKFIYFDGNYYDNYKVYVTVFIIIGVTIFTVLSMLSNIYILVKMLKGNLPKDKNMFFLLLVTIFSGIAPGVLCIIERHSIKKQLEMGNAILKKISKKGSSGSSEGNDTKKPDKPMKKATGLAELLDAA